jgi:hypothetical protein
MTIFIQPILQVVMICVERHESLIWLCVATAVGGCILPLFLPREKRKRAVDGLSELCGARGDHVYRFGQVTYCTRTDKITRTRAMLNSGMGTRHNHQGTLRLFLPHLKEEKVIQRFHGIDRHKKLSTISVVSQEGQEIQFLPACWDLRKYIEDLGSEDAVILEVSSGAFWWADRIEAKGATCYILDPHRFRIIKDSWKKTDKYDARNMVKALWVHLVTGEFGIPSVYKPSGLTRELGKLFSQHELLNRQIRMLKNNIQAILLENGIVISRKEVLQLISPQEGAELLKELDISEASRTGIEVSQQLLWAVLEKKDRIQAADHHQGDYPADGAGLSGGCGRRDQVQEPAKDERLSGVGSEDQRERGQEQARTYQSGIPQAHSDNSRAVDSSRLQLLSVSESGLPRLNGQARLW